LVAVSVFSWLRTIACNNFWLAFRVYVDIDRKFKFTLVVTKIFWFLVQAFLAINHAKGADQERKQVGNFD